MLRILHGEQDFRFHRAIVPGDDWPHEAGTPAPGHGFDEQWRSTSADFVVEQKFDEEQTFRYAETAGDPMPIHLDEEFAKSISLPGLILHGRCTMAFTSHAVLSQVAPHNPERLKRLAVRFASPGRPGQVMTTSIWNTGGGIFTFEGINNEGQVLIKDGLAEIEGA